MPDISACTWLRFEIVNHFLALFPGDVVQTVSHHVDDAKLDLSFGVDSFNGFWKTFEFTIFLSSLTVIAGYSLGLPSGRMLLPLLLNHFKSSI